MVHRRRIVHPGFQAVAARRQIRWQGQRLPVAKALAGPPRRRRIHLAQRRAVVLGPAPVAGVDQVHKRRIGPGRKARRRPVQRQRQIAARLRLSFQGKAFQRDLPVQLRLPRPHLRRWRWIGGAKDHHLVVAPDQVHAIPHRLDKAVCKPGVKAVLVHHEPQPVMGRQGAGHSLRRVDQLEGIPALQPPPSLLVGEPAVVGGHTHIVCSVQVKEPRLGDKGHQGIAWLPLGRHGFKGMVVPGHLLVGGRLRCWPKPHRHPHQRRAQDDPLPEAAQPEAAGQGKKRRRQDQVEGRQQHEQIARAFPTGIGHKEQYGQCESQQGHQVGQRRPPPRGPEGCAVLPAPEQPIDQAAE